MITVKDFLLKCDTDIYIQIKKNGFYVNRGKSKDLLEMDEIERLNSEIITITSQLYNTYSEGKHLADIVLVI